MSNAVTFSSRRTFITQSSLRTLLLLAPTTTSLLPLPANAKAKEDPPITRQLVTTTFSEIRSELTSPTGLVSTLADLISARNYDEILQYTKESDAYFRKGKLGRARKLLTDKDLKGEAIGMSNAVTFDLIGINRASRPGKENAEEQNRYLEELKKDVERFLELEKTIVVVDE
eukprot:CAMPEP_0184475636 /NCGR_PEP_ID=MMETSP0740-20130409/146665_1 /TAXON_ID=385413 /ORGANISM="Thalassiosira miniscula, Strain CCMP1093" /LENGTH=171 /DNA_ID=CAMNT_0026853155 /DNA_START=579 /DNA_END=1097 /DNA_ORIENTATION=-